EDYHSTYNDQSLDLALLMHAIEMEMFQQRYGQPLQLHSIADVMAYNEIYRQKYARRRLRPKLIQSIAALLGIIYGVVLPMAVYAVAATNFNYIYGFLLLIPFLIVGLFVLLLFLWSYGFIGIRIKKAL
ncbi:MAG: hypothetical protein K8I82_01145, partial [Anaerolineae bacterium]|nr:hypothetical protein [Anaerolineae bacterium]